MLRGRRQEAGAGGGMRAGNAAEGAEKTGGRYYPASGSSLMLLPPAPTAFPDRANWQ